MRRRGLTIIWPQYFDANRSCREGRKLTKDLCTVKPTIEDLQSAAKRMKLYAEVDSNAKYPRSTWDSPGLVLVDTKGMKKNDFLKKLAPVVKRANEYRITTSQQKKKTKHKKTSSENRMELIKKKIADQKKK